MDLDADQWVETLPVAQQQLVEIAKALSLNAKVIVMDEPTSALNAPEVDKLFGLDRAAQESRGVGSSTSLTRWRKSSRLPITSPSCATAVWSGPASAVTFAGPRADSLDGGSRSGAAVSAARTARWRRASATWSISVSCGAADALWMMCRSEVRAGEIVGVAGLQGSGNSELLMGLFGALRPQSHRAA